MSLQQKLAQFTKLSLNKSSTPLNDLKTYLVYMVVRSLLNVMTFRLSRWEETNYEN